MTRRPAPGACCRPPTRAMPIRCSGRRRSRSRAGSRRRRCRSPAPAPRAIRGDARMWQVLGLAHRRLDDLAAGGRGASPRRPRWRRATPLIAHSLARATHGGGPARASICSSARSALAPDRRRRSCSAWPPPSSPRARSTAAIAGLEAQLAPQSGLDRRAMPRRRGCAGCSASARRFTASFERALAAAPRRGRALARAGRHADACRPLRRGAGRDRARPRRGGPEPALRRARGGLPRRAGRDRKGRPAVRRRSGRSSMSPWRPATCAICCAPAVRPRRPPSPRPGRAATRPIAPRPICRRPGG